jgi:hypothetical protein
MKWSTRWAGVIDDVDRLQRQVAELVERQEDDPDALADTVAARLAPQLDAGPARRSPDFRRDR